MVVFGGMHLLEEDDDEDLFGQRKSFDRTTTPTSVYLPRAGRGSPCITSASPCRCPRRRLRADVSSD
jgi:hypothetical protein